MKSSHIKGDAIQNARAPARLTAWRGMAHFISLSTPDGDVKGVDPVKFIARPGVRKTQLPIKDIM